MDFNLLEHDFQLPTYRSKGRNTGLPVGFLNSDDPNSAHKYFKFEQWKENPNTEFDCFLSSERCQHKNKSGRQCTRKTVMGVQRCWQHLKLHWKLRIKDTGTTMGLGVFAVGKTNNPNEIVLKQMI